MWIWSSSVLLATLVVSGLSFPHPDDREYKIPEVGTGQRSQYYVLHRDGTFKYGFDTGDGAFESVKSHSPGSRDGKFGYVDDDGNKFKLEYEAGEGGFVARGDHLPKPSAALAEALAAVVQRSEPFTDPLASADSDASYGFKFKSDAYSRDEEADSDGTVTGSYSYTDENGVLRKFTYRAGKGIGFVIEGDGLTQDVRPSPPATKFGSVRSSVLERTPARTVGAAFRQPTAVSGTQAVVSSFRSQKPWDPSYSFSYDAGDHSRKEESDDKLNVEGTFSFVADDGQRRTLNYEAGSKRGFVAEGDHIPRDHASGFGSRLRSPTGIRTSLTSASQKFRPRQRYSGDDTGLPERPRSHFTTPIKPPSQQYQASQHQIGQRQQVGQRHQVKQDFVTRDSSTSFQGQSGQRRATPVDTKKSTAVSGDIRTATRTAVLRPFEEANVRSSSSPDGSYSFSYKTSSHSRDESGDADNNVVGRFDFVADDDGERREIKYEAGSATGFIAEGDHIPVGPEVPGAPSGQPTGRIVPVVEIPFIDPLADSDTDASYKFEFDSDTYSRSENADEDGNVAGTYTVVEDDGTRKTYRFRAGKGIGFETEEVSRTQGPKPAPRTPYTGPLASDFPGTFRTGTGQSIRTGTQRLDAARITDTKVTASRGQDYTRRIPTAGVGSQTPQGTSFTSGASYRTGTQQVQRPSSYSGTSRTTQSEQRERFSNLPEVVPTFKHGTQVQDSTRSQTQAHRVNLQSAFTPTHSRQVFPGFTLHTYSPSLDAEKFGYVLKYD